MLTQRSVQFRLGKNEHHLLLDIPPFRVVGSFYSASKFRIQDALRSEQSRFVSLGNAQVTFLPDPTISFVTDERVVNTARIGILCASFETG